ncbi:DnaK protein (macronuclear) [Tetrahymena thermophila SB210]|uniref:DnaK protein n=1 Tax=Tetrahymena thermophila (strain SB210) TaxID=312017 RepID=W7XCY0_TETTS|nr:DnaK protein [Tetrahymena thermophila SB210]EWS75312.1 DnaK protein [Tetrahymena thermophila SB210]|eukprot:XP_012652144.1 DnaK protein [Tetrahymena thermophila SB210]
MSSDTSEFQVIEEKNSDESQFENIQHESKEINNSGSNNNNNNNTYSNIIMNSSSEEQNDKEIIDNIKQENNEKENQDTIQENIQQGYKIVNNFNSSESDSNDTSQDDDAKVTFTEKIKLEIASNLKAKIIDFIRKVQQNPKIQDDMPEYIQDHIYEFEHVFQEIFQEPQAVHKLNGEAIEVIVIKPLHDILMKKYPVKQDKRLEFYFRVYEFITLTMFEIDSAVLKHPNYTKATKCLQKIDQVKTPKEKLNLIASASVLLSKALQTIYPKMPVGADQLLPMMIFTIIQAKPEKPYANLMFTQEYRCKWRIKGIDQYYLATYESALEFIDCIDAQKLKINETIFDQLYSKNYEKYKDLGYLHEFEQKKINPFLTSTQSLSMLQKVEKQMQDLNQKMNIDEQLNLKFVNQNLSTVKLNQLPEVYAEYQMMVDGYKDMIQRSQKILQSLDDFCHNENNKKSIFNIF